jgi:hypothetical protein
MMHFEPKMPDLAVPSPTQIGRAVAFVRAFYPAEWRGTAGISEAEAKLLAEGSPEGGFRAAHAAVALGRLGGLKARAKALSAKKRSAIAKKAAQKRWAKKN